MIRIHHTDMPRIITSRLYDQKPDYKPTGLWYGIDWAWEDWCIANMPDWQHNNHFELDIDLTKILVLNSVETINDFELEFGDSPSWIKTNEIKITGWGINMIYIDWKKVAEKYSGIEINPYLYSVRRSKMWISGWDISSGCIWDLSAVKSFKPISKNK